MYINQSIYKLRSPRCVTLRLRRTTTCYGSRPPRLPPPADSSTRQETYSPSTGSTVSLFIDDDDDDDDKFTPTTPNTPSSPQQPARSGSHRHGDTTTIQTKGRARRRTAPTDV